jgi:hypothetical protein
MGAAGADPVGAGVAESGGETVTVVWSLAGAPFAPPHATASRDAMAIERGTREALMISTIP